MNLGRIIFRLAMLAVVSGLGACGGVQPNELSLDNDGGGKFSGMAGMGWTVDQLKEQVKQDVCGGSEPKVFIPRSMNDAYIFSGNC